MGITSSLPLDLPDDDLSPALSDVLDELLDLACDAEGVSEELTIVFRLLASTIARLPSRRREMTLAVLGLSFDVCATEAEELGCAAVLLLQVAFALAANHDGAVCEALAPLMESARSKLEAATELSTEVVTH